MTINGEIHGKVKKDQVVEILSRYKEGVANNGKIDAGNPEKT